jgi:hypothetical protein
MLFKRWTGQSTDGSLDIFSPESHQRSWWIFHIQPTKASAHFSLPRLQLSRHLAAARWRES